MIFKRGSSWLALAFLAALIAASIYGVGTRVRVERPRTEAAIQLAALPSPVRAEIDRIVDGDTFRIFVTLRGGERISAPVRIRGVDAPELHGQCASEIQAARDSARALGELLRDEVLLDRIGSDKYERVLARVQVRRGGALVDVAETLVREGHGRAYEGRKRGGWC